MHPIEKNPNLSQSLALLYFVCSGVLFLAIFRMPSGYYDFLRIAVTVGAVIAIAAELKTGLSGWVVALAILAVLFNPISPIYLYKKSTRVLIDAIAGVTFLLKGWMHGRRPSNS
jgi:hypothetical protein